MIPVPTLTAGQRGATPARQQPGPVEPRAADFGETLVEVALPAPPEPAAANPPPAPQGEWIGELEQPLAGEPGALAVPTAVLAPLSAPAPSALPSGGRAAAGPGPGPGEAEVRLEEPAGQGPLPAESSPGKLEPVTRAPLESWGAPVTREEGASAEPGSPAGPQGVQIRSPEAPGGSRSSEAATPRPPTADAPLAADVLRQVRVAVDARRRSAVIRLEPRELGRLSIRLEVEDGHVRAVVRADSARTLELLERHLPELRASLGQQGLEADELDLALSPERDPREAPSQGERQGASARHPADRDPLPEIEDPHNPGTWIAGPGLDTYA